VAWLSNLRSHDAQCKREVIKIQYATLLPLASKTPTKEKSPQLSPVEGFYSV